MASLITTSLLAVGLLATPPADRGALPQNHGPEILMAQARNGCGRAIAQALAMTGGELLSAHPARSGRPVCVLTILVTNAKGRPKKVRMRIPMDF